MTVVKLEIWHKFLPRRMHILDRDLNLSQTAITCWFYNFHILKNVCVCLFWI